MSYLVAADDLTTALIAVQQQLYQWGQQRLRVLVSRVLVSRVRAQLYSSSAMNTS
jgi:hypothetical protein